MPLTVGNVQHELSDFDLDPEIIAGLWRMEERHFWHRARNGWIRRALAEKGVLPGARVLEVGCGSGAVAGYLHAHGYVMVGVDTAEPLVRKAHERFPEVTFFVDDVARLPPSVGPFDAVGFFDVLEHLDAPLDLLGAGCAHARPGAVVAVTVPALGELHSVIDDLSGHKRRYEPGELARLLEAAGLEAVEERGIFRSTLPLQRRFRRAGGAEDPRAAMLANLRVPALPVNQALAAACAVERWLGFGSARDKAGATLLATARLPR